MSAQTKVRLLEVERYERRVKLRLPFRFGVITVTEGTQAIVRATIELADGRRSQGVAAEALAAKWFDKDPQYSDAQNEDQLRQSLDIAIGHYTALGLQTPFALYAKSYPDQLARGADLGLVPLVAGYGPALLDRAILDALGKAHAFSFFELIKRNVAGIGQTALTPDLAGFPIDGFLATLTPGATIDMRHTIGLVDPITASDQKPDQRVNDGLPETLEEVVRHYRGRYYKLKVGGDVAADLERLARIAGVLDKHAGDYRATLDGNEQYDDVAGIHELWRRMQERPELARLAKSILYIEQPIKRAVALSKSVRVLAAEKPLIIDESDGEIGTFPAALELGYAGVSSKTCKGLYKSMLNAARVSKLNAETGAPRAFLSGEDLTTLPGVSVQQDLALVSVLGLTHVERNAQHFVNGMSFATEREQSAFATAHPGLYSRDAGPARLIIARGRIALGSLACPGFAVGADMDFAALRPMAAAPPERIVPAHVGNRA